MRNRELIERVYGILPAPAQSAVATIRGYYLRAWRFGADSEALISEAIEREHWNDKQWSHWRGERLARLLHRAATLVPFYRDMWAARRRRGDRAPWDQLANWPILEKESVRHNASAFIADDRDRRFMFHEHTSGTTGTSLDIWRSRDTVRVWYAHNEARWRRWYGVSASDRWAMFGGQLVVPIARSEPPFWVWNAALHQLYCSSYHIAPGAAGAYAREMHRRGVTYVLAYPSALHALATAINEQGAPAPQLKVAIANAEPVYTYQRESIKRAFGCELRETYGLAEMVTAAGECEHGTMHLWPDAGVLEVVQGGESLPRGIDGDLVGTGLINADMPLIRYRIGDRGALAAGDVVCACGRTLPALARLEGRSDDVLLTRDGRAIGRLDPVFKAHLPVHEAQIIQESLDSVRVRYVPSAGFSPHDAADLSARLCERMGNVRVILEEVTSIPREPNGKFRAVICALSPAERMTAVSR
jgi:phenylacetate-CoA ligase